MKICLALLVGNNFFFGSFAFVCLSSSSLSIRQLTRLIVITWMDYWYPGTPGICYENIRVSLTGCVSIVNKLFVSKSTGFPTGPSHIFLVDLKYSVKCLILLTRYMFKLMGVVVNLT